jgi:hypothetical protein
MKIRELICPDRKIEWLKIKLGAFAFASVMAPLWVTAQNVGIGTLLPQKTLTVNGTILLDQGNNNQGGLDSAALLFGTSGGVGIISNKTAAGSINSLSFFTNNNMRMNISAAGNIGIGGINNGGSRLYVMGTTNMTGSAEIGGNLNVEGDGIIDNNFRINGRIGINGATNGSFGLMVNNSNSYFEGNITTTGTASIGGTVQATGNVNVGSNLNVTNDGIINNNFRVNGRVGINGPTNGSFGLIVNNSNSYFQGNITATGTVNAAGDLTIKGNGHVRSNGPSNLRVSFIARTVDQHINNGASAAVLVNTGFTGGNNDVRVMVSQVMSDPGASVQWQRVNIMVSSVANDGTCNLWLNNHSGANGIVKGTVYLTVIGKD